MTKHRVVVKVLASHAFALVSGGGSQEHEKYTDGYHTVSVPRHREISNRMAEVIYREAGIPKGDWRL